MEDSAPQKTPLDPPLVDVKVTNPVTYFKKWWSKIIGNEGVDFRFHIKPLTALLISAIIAAVAFGSGVVVTDEIPSGTTAPTATPQDLWKETAYTGTLQYSESKNTYYLLTSSSPEAITLEVPSEVNIPSLVGKRILAIGDYSKSTKILKVTDIKDLEVLSKTPVPVPTITPTPTGSPIGALEDSPSPTSAN